MPDEQTPVPSPPVPPAPAPPAASGEKTIVGVQPQSEKDIPEAGR